MSLVVRKPAFCICENKDADQLRGNREADQHLCFRYTDKQFLYYLNPKFQASSHLLWPHSPVCVGPGQKPRRPVFSQRGSCNMVKLVVGTLSEALLMSTQNLFVWRTDNIIFHLQPNMHFACSNDLSRRNKVRI